MFASTKSFFSKALGLISFGMALYAAPAAAVSPYDAGTLPAAQSYTQSVFHSPGSFVDIFNFNLVSSSDVSGATVSLTLSIGDVLLFNIINPTVNLYSQANPSVSLANGTTGFNVNNIAVGSYFVRVTGTANGQQGGQYLFGLSALPVPEPEQWMLFAAGLLAIGGISRRRGAF